MLQLKNIHLSYNGKNVFSNFGFSISEGEKILIKGPSGSGKTTIFKMLLGFVRPQKGDVIIDGHSLTKENIWQLRKRMAYVSQDLDVGTGKVNGFIQQIFQFKSNRNVIYDREKVLSKMEAFSLSPHLLEADLKKLSGGEKQRIIIITALLLDRPIYLLDEITSSLDDRLKQQTADYFSTLEQKTIVSISHDPVWENNKFRFVHLTDKK